MSGYCAYIIGNIGKDGHVWNRVAIEGADAEQAKRLAKQLVDGQAV